MSKKCPKDQTTAAHADNFSNSYYDIIVLLLLLVLGCCQQVF